MIARDASGVPWITLEPYELEIADYVGRLRRAKHEEADAVGGHGISQTDKENQLAMDCMGARAELAFAKFIGVYWTNAFDDVIGEYPKSDVGGYGVRSTEWPDGCLMVHKRDPDEQTFVLVIVASPFFRFPGSMIGSAAKQEKWWDVERTRSGAYMIPQRRLTGWDGG